MLKSSGARVGIVLVVLVLLSSLAVTAASAAPPASPSERSSEIQSSSVKAGGYGCTQSYRVRPGDTLTKIAYRFGTTINALMSCNNIWNPDKIYIGQWLCICGGYHPKPKPPCVQSCGQPCGQPCPPPKPPPCVQQCGAPCGQPCPQPQPCPYPQPQPQPQPQPWPNPEPPPCGQTQPPPPPPQPWPPKHGGGCTVGGTCCTDTRSVITYPRNSQHVWGFIPIMGTAVVKDFDYYKLEYGAGKNPDEWSWFYSGGWQVSNGQLGMFNADAMPPGTYSIRLTVVDKTGNYPPQCQVTIVVN